MSNEEIKAECELQYQQIKNAEQRLRELRMICKHEKTFEGKYAWRVGAVEPAVICSFCGIVLLVGQFFVQNYNLTHNEP